MYPLLKNRIIRSSKSAHVSSPQPSQPVRPEKNKKWTQERLKLAYDAVLNEELSICEAADAFDVPKSTLHDRVSGRVPFGKLSGFVRYLSDAEETNLIKFIKQSAKIGAAKSKADVISIVQRVVDAKYMKVKVTSGWWESFKRRHKNEVSLRKA